jgi:hypothetical protein
LAECLVRLAISYATLPERSPGADPAGEAAGEARSVDAGSGSDTDVGSSASAGAGAGAGAGSAGMTASSIAELLGPYIDRALGG